MAEVQAHLSQSAVRGAHHSRLRRLKGTLLAAALLAAVPQVGAALTPTPCDELTPAELSFEVRVDPQVVMVGEPVTLDAEISNRTGGLAGIPTFTLDGANGLLAIEDEEHSYPQVTFVRYRLRATSAGVARLQVQVSYETSIGCRDAPVFTFRFARSGTYLVQVRAADTPTATPTETMPPTPSATPSATSSAPVTPTATSTATVTATPSVTATPTVTPTPAARPCIGDCDRDGVVRVDELLRGVAVALAGSEPASCPAADGDGDRRVSIAELIAAIAAALNGCALTPG